MESPRQKLILEEGGGVICRNVAWGSDCRQQACLRTLHRGTDGAWVPQGQVTDLGSGKGCTAGEGQNTALEPGQCDEMGEETG